MKYEIYITPYARRKLKKLPLSMEQKIRKKIEDLSYNPFDKKLDIKKLVNSPYYRLRVNDYRIIYNIIEAKLIIELVDVGHRKEIYH